MNEQKEILEGYSNLEKGAYLGAIATIATADRTATEEEMEYLEALCESANLTDSQTDMIKRAANELTGDELKKSLDVLKTSSLKYSLITDMIAFAESDGSYTDEERKEIERIATYLGVNEKQFSLLDEFAHEATEEAETVSSSGGEQSQKQSFLSGGLKDKMQDAGIDTSGLMKGLIGVMGPILLAGMLGGGRRRRSGGIFGNNTGGGGMFGNTRGGGMMGGGAMGGGLGSLIGMLGGGRRSRPTGRSGGLFGGLFKGF
jgi:tellurite resistance protein